MNRALRFFACLCFNFFVSFICAVLFFYSTNKHTRNIFPFLPENGTTGLESSGSFEVINNIEQQDEGTSGAATNGFDGGK